MNPGRTHTLPFTRPLWLRATSPWLLRLARPLFTRKAKRYRRLSVPLAGPQRDLGREHKEIMDCCSVSQCVEHSGAIFPACRINNTNPAATILAGECLTGYIAKLKGLSVTTAA